jgi:hypothetical protein
MKITRIVLATIILALMIIVGYELIMSDYGISKFDTEQFMKYNQYDTKYIAYSHEDMMLLCEKHDLIYDYEEGECISELQWDIYESQKEQQ